MKWIRNNEWYLFMLLAFAIGIAPRAFAQKPPKDSLRGEIVDPWPGEGPPPEPCAAAQMMQPAELQAYYLGEINRSLQGIRQELQRIVARMDKAR